MPTYSLLVVAGNATGTRLEVHDEGLVLGRSSGRVGRLGDDEALSRRHASLTPTPSGGLLLEDLGSTNGTFVNGDRLAGPYVLRAGDVVRVGATELQLVEPEPTDPRAWRGGAAVGGNVHADRGSIGAIGSVGGDVDLSRRTVRADRGGVAAGGDVYHSEEHLHDASGWALITRTRGAARFFIILGIFVSLAGFASFGYPIVRELVSTTGLGSSPSPAELTQARRDCEARFPAFSDERFECIVDANDRLAAQSTDGFGPDLTPWLPIGAVLFLAGMAFTLVGMFLIRRED